MLPDLLSAAATTRLERYLKKKSDSGVFSQSDSQVPNTPSAYGDPVIDKLLEYLIPTVERIAQRGVYPTYSYCRLYKQDDVLKKHTDRSACQISLSLCIALDPPAPWPLWVEGFKMVAPIKLTPGDAVIYLGADCAHWRDEFTGNLAVQAFLHYVDKHGPHSEWKYDKRTALAHHNT